MPWKIVQYLKSTIRLELKPQVFLPTDEYFHPSNKFICLLFNRYNAEKTKVGMYYSTPVYQFRMKCHLCDNHFEIKTDPAVRFSFS